MSQIEPTRRDVIKAVAGATLAGAIRSVSTAKTGAKMPHSDIIRFPDYVRVLDGKNEAEQLNQSAPGEWHGKNFTLKVLVERSAVKVFLQGGNSVSRIQLRWKSDLNHVTHLMGDHWERSYADMEWRGHNPNRTMPWFFMASDGKTAHGYGVRTGANAMCFWNADTEGISLWADVRNGGNPVQLQSRELFVCEVLSREGKAGESAFKATQEFCKLLCPSPRLPKESIYGTNDWNYAYGNSSAELILRVAGLVSELSPNRDNRPFSVIDEGWAMGPYNDHFGYGPWVGNPKFGDMGKVADKLKAQGIRPGIWFRPLTTLPDMPESWKQPGGRRYLDPTIPEVRDHVATHMKRFVGWGYEMVKHDFTSFDVFGQWGFQMGPSPTKDGWPLNDKSLTNAEILKQLYQTIRDAAGDAYLIGCNTVGHLSAGTHEIQRIGDDTSGQIWDRNRRMGINTLAFRAPHHKNFYIGDPDIVSITEKIPWHLSKQWLKLVSESDLALFVAVQPEFITQEHRTALSHALDISSKPQKVAEPLDWMDNSCPQHWRLRGSKCDFQWMEDSGSWPFGD